MLTITYAQDVKPKGLTPPDIAWSGTAGDFAPDPVYGLQGDTPIRTAIVMLLFTDVACDPRDLRFEHGGDRRGWAGDGFGIDPTRGEQPLGSTLWLLRRSTLDEAVARKAEAECVRALQPLVKQKIATTIVAKARINGLNDRLEMMITLGARDGRPVYSDQFDILWKVVS